MADRDAEILLVEDNPADIEMALYALEQNEISHRIHVARDGAEALDYVFGSGAYQGRCREDAPKLILLDLGLPRMDGLELLRRLKADARTRQVPVVVMTGSAEDREMCEAYDCGADGFLVKPMDFEQFMEMVRKLGAEWLEVDRQPEYPGNRRP